MRLIFAGTPAPALVALDALLASRHDVVAVVSRPDAPSGRGRSHAGSPVSERARERGLELLTPASPRDPAFIGRVVELAPDCAPIVAYGGLITSALLTVPRHGWVNLHFSLLPRWRGAAPVQHAIWNGDDVTGASTFLLDEGLDTGPVLAQVIEEIGPLDTSGALLERLAISGARLLVDTLDALEDGSATPVAQSIDGVTVAPKISVDDARVHWDSSAEAVDRQVRACTPHPGAWTTWGDARVKLQPVTLAPESLEAPALPPGQVAVIDRRVLVGTGTAPVLLGDVQPQGRKSMPAADWHRGLRVSDVLFS
jgi:methionyl-tRNA formyltransferase